MEQARAALAAELHEMQTGQLQEMRDEHQKTLDVFGDLTKKHVGSGGLWLCTPRCMLKTCSLASSLPSKN